MKPQRSWSLPPVSEIVIVLVLSCASTTYPTWLFFSLVTPSWDLSHKIRIHCQNKQTLIPVIISEFRETVDEFRGKRFLLSWRGGRDGFHGPGLCKTQTGRPIWVYQVYVSRGRISTMFVQMFMLRNQNIGWKINCGTCFRKSHVSDSGNPNTCGETPVFPASLTTPDGTRNRFSQAQNSSRWTKLKCSKSRTTSPSDQTWLLENLGKVFWWQYHDPWFKSFVYGFSHIPFKFVTIGFIFRFPTL
jgi:hypothetical protein